MNGPYENLIHLFDENEACAYSADRRSSGPVADYRNRGASTAGRSCCSSNGDGSGGDVSCCRTVALIAVLLGALVSVGLSGWVHYSMMHRCNYATFVLDSDSLRPCGNPRTSSAPCSVNSSNSISPATYLTGYEYNNAVGPWKLDEVEIMDGDGFNCEFQLERRGTHLIVGQAGLYQLTAQVTFADDYPAHLEWQVGHAEWIATKRGRDPQSGPTQTRLEAVRRLGAGEKLSLHLDKDERRLATGAQATFITLVRL